MSTRKRRDSGKERVWRRLLREWRRSGLSVRDFCAEHRVSQPSFYFWRRTIAQRDTEPAGFVPVQVVADERESAGNGSRAGLELVLAAGRRLRIGPNFEAATLRRLLPVLEEGRP